VAVALFLAHPEASLTLHLPCEWDTKSKKHVDKGSADWRTNPGYLANACHAKFSKVVHRNTLTEIQEALDRKATAFAYKGFHQRNVVVGKSQFLLAFTFSTSGTPQDGGTLHTWKHSCSKKTHICLADP
jgi:hypothetical protein